VNLRLTFTVGGFVTKVFAVPVVTLCVTGGLLTWSGM
jgi:hypothetical protein